MRKNIRQIPRERNSTKYLTSTPQNCQGQQKQEKPEIVTATRNPGYGDKIQCSILCRILERKIDIK